MKLIIQIPCYNEEKTLPFVLKDFPKKIKGINKIETQVIDDGSLDKTFLIAKKYKVKHIIRFKKNKGLALAFKAGVDNALKKKADILVNTDGDNQYRGGDIIKLVRPILRREADIVIGQRPINNHPEFSYVKKQLQKIGSFILSHISNTKIKDASSGFRAYNREALLHLNIFSNFSYCMETLIQTGQSNLKMTTVNIRINSKTRESRLFKNIFEYLWKSAKTIINIFMLYKAHQFFTFFSVLFLLASFILAFRYLILVVMNHAPAHSFWPSVILAGILLVLSFITYLTGILASLIAANRKLSEEILFRLKKLEIKNLSKK